MELERKKMWKESETDFVLALQRRPSSIVKPKLGYIACVVPHSIADPLIPTTALQRASWKLDDFPVIKCKDLYDFLFSTIFGKVKQGFESLLKRWNSIFDTVIENVEDCFFDKVVVKYMLTKKLFIYHLKT